jgi:hypothetical protein
MLIALTGPAGCGKDTVCQMISERIPVVRIGFADALKKSAAALLDVSVEDVEILKRLASPCVGIMPHKMMTMRKFLQRYGTESHRDIFGQDFWVNLALTGDDLAYNSTSKAIVVTDLRFENEAFHIKQLHGVIIHINRPSGHEGYVVEGAGHLSEKGVPAGLIDFVLDNDCSLEALRECVHRTLAKITMLYDHRHLGL